MTLIKPADPYPAAEYLPLLTLLIPIIATNITATSNITDWQRILLLGLTIHLLIQFMRLPSGLIRASQTTPLIPYQQQQLKSKLLLELKIINLFSISLLLLSPFLALLLLRILQSATFPLIDQFAIRLCFIAVAIRPSAYLIKLIQNKENNIKLPNSITNTTNSLSNAVQDLELRSENLSKSLDKQAQITATTTDLETVYNQVKPSIRDLRRALNALIRRRKELIPRTLHAHHILNQNTLHLKIQTNSIIDQLKNSSEFN